MIQEQANAAATRREDRILQHHKLGAIADARRKQDATERKALHDAVVRSCLGENTIRWLLRPAVTSIEAGADVTQDMYWKLVVQSAAGLSGETGQGAAWGRSSRGGGGVEAEPALQQAVSLGLLPEGSAVHPQTWK